MGSIPPIEAVDEIGSTNAGLMARGRAGAQHGTAIRAAVQTAGRGRRDHAWRSPAGGLYLSVLIRPHVAPRLLPGLPVACALGALGSLRDAGAKGALLKWPNDVIVGDRKLAGILTELGGLGGGAFAVCGIGVNVVRARADPDDARMRAGLALRPVSLTECAGEGGPCDLGALAERVRAGILASASSWEHGLVGEGGGAEPLTGIVDGYNAHLAFMGEPVTVFAVDGAPAARGLFRGVDAQGHALVDLDGGRRAAYDAAAVSIRPRRRAGA